MYKTAYQLFNSIEKYHEQLLAGNTSCVAAVKYYLGQIERHNHLNAFTEVYGEEALETAALLDKKQKAGETFRRSHGVVIGIKDVLCYKDHRVTAASKILEGFV